MKKTLVALAALAATSAFAQSTVEIYGIIDQSVGQTTSKLTTVDGTQKNVAQNTGIQSGLATQRLGFRGTEDLGGGTKAIFQIESSISAGNAATNGLGGRPTFVGLSSATMGTLTLGRQDTPMLKAVVPQLAGGANNAIGQIMWSGFSLNSNTWAAPVAADGMARIASQTTIDRAVNYKTATFNGVDAEVQYGKNGTKFSETGAETDKDATTDTGYNVKYAAGALTLNAANHVNKTTTNSLEAAKVKNSYLGATYDLGFAKLSLQNGTDKRTNAGEQVYKNKGTQFGVQVPVSATVAAFGSLGKGKRDYGTDGDNNWKQTSYQLGAAYSFSKRTKLYGVYGSQQLKANSEALAGAKFKETQYVVGLNHSF